MKRRLAVVLFPLITAAACYGMKAMNTTARGPYQIEP